MVSSTAAVREKLLAVLESQIDIAFSYVELARNAGGAARDQLLRAARRTYDSAVSLRHHGLLRASDAKDVDRQLDRLVIAFAGVELDQPPAPTPRRNGVARK